MTLYVIKPDRQTAIINSSKDFEELFQVKFYPHLEFGDSKVKCKIENLCEKALKKGWIEDKKKWLGAYYSQEIHAGAQKQNSIIIASLDLTIAWIDDKVGYGLFTNRDISANSFVGEYTGLVRKRRWLNRWRNLYCFDYQIKEGKSSSFVIDAEKAGNHTRFINHSFEGNLEPISVYDQGLMHVILRSSKKIYAGKQLCYDYGADYWKKRAKPETIFPI